MSFFARVLFFLVRVYQVFFSALMPSACKFYPSCSHYAAEAVAVHGARRGSWLALRRIGRCHPFSRGGVDLVPGAEEVLSGSGSSLRGFDGAQNQGRRLKPAPLKVKGHRLKPMPQKKRSILERAQGNVDRDAFAAGGRVVFDRDRRLVDDLQAAATAACSRETGHFNYISGNACSGKFSRIPNERGQAGRFRNACNNARRNRGKFRGDRKRFVPRGNFQSRRRGTQLAAEKIYGRKQAAARARPRSSGRRAASPAAGHSRLRSMTLSRKPP